MNSAHTHIFSYKVPPSLLNYERTFPPSPSGSRSSRRVVGFEEDRNPNPLLCPPLLPCLDPAKIQVQGDWLFNCVKCLCFVPAVGIQRRARQVKLGYGTKQAESPCAHSLSSQLPFVRDELVPCIFFARRIHPSCRPSLCNRALCLDQGRRRRRGGGRKGRNDLCSESCPTRQERPATAMDGGWHFGRAWKTGALPPNGPQRQI